MARMPWVRKEFQGGKTKEKPAVEEVFPLLE